MKDLLQKKCVPCEGGVIPFDISEIHKYQKKVDGWDILKNEKKYFIFIRNINLKIF
jgi:4a-hydroxytetrahydrobiopterin dehydratase